MSRRRRAAQRVSEPSAAKPLLSVIFPTYNERETIGPLVTAVLEGLGGTPAEVLVVDDSSPDGTAEAARALAAADSRVRLLSRPGKLGLASAVFDGVAQARGEYLCVMDADFSHDPGQVPGMLAKAQEGYDLVIGSRYAVIGEIEGWPTRRRLISKILTAVARAVLGLRARDVLSGFVVCRRHVLAELPTRYSARGFKFLLEVLATRPGLAVSEWPITFRDRRQGRSKASAREGAELVWLCVRLLRWKGARRIRRLLRSAG